MGKGEIAHEEQFLSFQQCFLLNQITVSPFVHIFHIISLFAAEFEEPKIGISGKELKVKIGKGLRVGGNVSHDLGVGANSINTINPFPKFTDKIFE